MALRNARQVVVFSGAGVSAQSGIPTFRDEDGFWKRFPPEQFANWRGLLRTAATNPRRVAEFVYNVISPIAAAKPNEAHLAITRMEQYVSATVVTQNIDRLHQLAGSTRVLEVHGSLFDIQDVSTGKKIRQFQHHDLAAVAALLKEYMDKERSILSLLNSLRQFYSFDLNINCRPDIVLFGDDLPEPTWSDACRSAEQCDVLLSVGTSGAVYPAAMIPEYASAAGATIINIDPQPCDGYWLQGTAGEMVPRLVKAAWESDQNRDE